MTAAPFGRRLCVSRLQFLAVCGLLSASGILLRLASPPIATVTTGFCAVAVVLTAIAGFAAARSAAGAGERRTDYGVTISIIAFVIVSTGYATSAPALAAFIAFAVVAVMLEIQQSIDPHGATNDSPRASARGSSRASAASRFQDSPPGSAPITSPLAEVESVDPNLERRLLARLGGDVPPFKIHDRDDEPSDDNDDREATFRLERGILDDGTEWVEGIVQAKFSRGQKQTAVHIPLWPALGSIPEVHFESLGSSQVQIAATGGYRWGIRLEVQRTAGSRVAEAVEIAFFMTAPRARSEAA